MDWLLGKEVALLAEGVDRNTHAQELTGAAGVALLAEGVDRNSYRAMFFYGRKCVALLAEGVDRNPCTWWT